MGVSDPMTSLDQKQRAELDYWTQWSAYLTTGCTTPAERADALYAVCWKHAFPRYKDCLFVDELSFQGLKIVDIGCGPHAGIIGFEGCEKVGVDHLIDEYARLGYPLERHGITYVNSKIEATPLPSAEFDRVICINALDHFDDLAQAIAEISRLLTPGGKFMGVFHFHSHSTPCEPLRLDHEELVRLGTMCGLRLDRRVFREHAADVGEDRYYYEFTRV